jgi:hypothetical protein
VIKMASGDQFNGTYSLFNIWNLKKQVVAGMKYYFEFTVIAKTANTNQYSV